MIDTRSGCWHSPAHAQKDCPNWLDNDEVVCNDLDLVIESLAANGEREEAERLKHVGRGYLTGFNGRQTPATSRTFSAFDVSNAILDVVDDGHVVGGLRYGWKFDYPDEDRANAERLDFRDQILRRLKGER